MFGNKNIKENVRKLIKDIKCVYGQIGALQSKVDKNKNEIMGLYSKITDILKDHVSILRNLQKNSEKYVECSECRCLVNKEKAKFEWEMKENQEVNSCGLLLWRINGEPQMKAVKTYKCIHCQPKTKKSNKK